MKRIKNLILMLAIGTAQAALAGGGHSHGAKPVYGGVVAQANEFDFELVAREGRLALHAFNHGKPVALAGAKAAATIHGRGEKIAVEFKPSGDNMLLAEGRFPVGLGVRAEVRVTLPGKPEARLNFRLK